MLIALRHVKAIEPCFFRAEAFFCAFCLFIVEEKDVSGYACIWCEDAARQSDDGVKVEFT